MLLVKTTELIKSHIAAIARTNYPSTAAFIRDARRLARRYWLTVS